MTPDLAQEVKRKLFHLLSLLYLALYVAAGRTASLIVLGSATVLVAVVEAARLRSSGFNQFMLRAFRGIHREKEINKPSGVLWTLLGSFLTILLTPHPDIVMACLAYLALGDTAASLVGRTWGHIRIGGKSLEGSLACFITCWALGMIFLTPDFGAPEVLIGALVVTLAEALSIPPNDNLWMPLLPALVLTWLRAAGPNI